MTPANLHSFFATSASVAGALVGLLFVAITVAQERLAAKDAAQAHRVRASAALSAFTNALVVSLFALLPDEHVGWAAFSVAVLGLLFIGASVLSLVRVRRSQPGELRDALFLIGLAITFGAELIWGLRVIMRPRDAGAVENVAVIVIVCFLLGIARSWELIGGPSIRMHTEIGTFLRPQRHGDDASDAPEGDRP